MSKIAITGPAGGTATYTVTAPTGATDRTLTLPDQTATLITDSAGVLNIGSGQVYKDASGNVGIGTSSPAVRLDLFGGNARVALATGSATTLRGYEIATGTTVVSSIKTNADSGELRIDAGFAGYGGLSTFYTNGTERARIDTSGKLLLGSTSDPVGTRFYVYSSDLAVNSSMVCATGTTNNGYYIDFRNSAGANSGRIEKTGTTTVAYTTTSDYRLKEDVQPMIGALTKVAALKPVTYKWKDDGFNGQGFIAHELQAVVPECVTGAKDAVETYTDKDGNEQTRPSYQGIDTSFLVATLTAAIQEQQALIAQLQADVAALKGTQP
jgi:hypothetical protein